MILLVLLSIFVSAQCGPATENYKGQHCTDPRTMRKHAAYTEWADAYSCTRHRCQPGGRNLAIYTVGCKRVEAPESAIECEEVVEDTNMQFPYCCTRLRCLVVVRGEVWTRVLGQPWESLPAAPWSHMYKMKKPPPGDTNFLPKVPEQGPVYELAEPEADNKVLRSMLAPTTETPNMKPDPSPDIVIALSTNNEQKSIKNELESLGEVRSKYVSSNRFDDEREQEPGLETDDNTQMTTEKSENSLEDRYYDNLTGTSKPGYSNLHNAHEWTDIPSQHWHARAEGTTESDGYNSFHQLETGEEKAEPKSTKLQALVNAIGTRMRDIENVVQKMTAKVHDAKVPDEYNSAEKGQGPDDEHSNKDLAEDRTKKPNEGDYKRFTSKVHANKYVRGSEMTTDLPLFLEDSHLNGYFSDASNSVLRRSNKQGAMQTYMAPVETRRKNTHILDSSAGTDVEKKHKKHHKKKKGKHGHKKHHKMDKRKKFSRISSSEFDKNVIVSLEDSSAVKK